MSHVLIPKAAAALLAATMVTGGAAVAWTVTHTGADRAKSESVRRLDGTAEKSLNLVPLDGLVDGAAATAGAGGADGSASAGASVSGGGGSGGVGASAGTTAQGGSPASATGGAAGSATGTTPGGSTTGGAAAGGSATGGTPSPGAGSGGSGGSGPGDSGAGNGGGSGGLDVTVPTTPTGVSLYREGSYNLFVPGTLAVSKKLCLSGEIDRCETLNVPALRAVNVAVSYSANASANAPTFAVFPCQGGLGVTVSGLTPQTSVMVKAEGRVLTRTLSAREVAQSASFCDA